MARKLCLIHANCQGEPLEELLGLHPEFGAEHEIRLRVNYLRQPVGDEELGQCDVFLYQHLGENWGALSSRSLLAGLKRGCRTFCVPNLFFKGYWPLWDNAPGMDYSDRLLNALADKGLSGQEALHLYLNADLNRFHDLDGLFEESLARERAKEAHWDLKLVDHVLAGFRDRLLFNTVNHPNKELVVMVVQGVLEDLGYPPLSPGALEGVGDPFPDFVHPIHPQVAERLGLSFEAGPETLWPVYGRRITFARYAADYLECRLQEMGDFIGYLRLKAERESGRGAD